MNSSGSEHSSEKQRASDCSQPESIEANSADDQEESKQEMEAIDQLLNVSMVGTDKVGFDSELTEPRKSIMKKPGTPVPGVLGKRTHAQTLQSMIHTNTKDDEPLQSNQQEDSESLQVIGFPASANMATKRVKFNQKHDRVHEFEV